jgi:hypothetical protein
LIDLHINNRECLNLREFESGAKLVCRVRSALTLSNDLERFIQRIVDYDQTLKDVNPLKELLSLESEALLGDIDAEIDKMLQARLER